MKMKSPCCGLEFILRGKSGHKGELLLLCPNPDCKSPKWQCREGEFSHPYQVKRRSDVETKSVSVRGRMKQSDYDSLIRKYGSFQKFLDFYMVM